MFESIKEYSDLIFSDSCVQLFPIETSVEAYLGSDMLEMLHKTDPRICNMANKLINNNSYFVLVLSLIVINLIF